MGSLIGIIVIFSVFGGSSWYIANRLHQGMMCFFKKLPFWPILVVMCIFALMVIVGFGSSFLPFSKGVKYVFSIIGYNFMGILLYLLLFTAFADLVVLIFKITKLHFTAWPFFRGTVTIGVLLLTTITCIYGYVNARQIDNPSYEISIKNKVDISDVKIAMISDLHLGSIGSEGRLEEIVSEINELNPDIVCIAGDFFDTNFESIQNPDKAIKTLRKIKATYGIYSCLGNHDGGETFNQMIAFLEEAGIETLCDEYEVIDERIILVGRLDASPIGGYDGIKRKALNEILPSEMTDNEKRLPIIVMDHNPARISEYGENVDLILCGHTHNGQVFPATLITNTMYTVDYGYYRKDNKTPHVIVSSGIGTWGLPMRVGSDSEIVNVTFTCGD